MFLGLFLCKFQIWPLNLVTGHFPCQEGIEVLEKVHFVVTDISGNRALHLFFVFKSKFDSHVLIFTNKMVPFTRQKLQNSKLTYRKKKRDSLTLFLVCKV